MKECEQEDAKRGRRKGEERIPEGSRLPIICHCGCSQTPSLCAGPHP